MEAEKLIFFQQFVDFGIDFFSACFVVLFFALMSTAEILFSLVEERFKGILAEHHSFETEDSKERLSFEVDRYRENYGLLCELVEQIIESFSFAILLQLCAVVNLFFNRNFIQWQYIYSIFVKYGEELIALYSRCDSLIQDLPVGSPLHGMVQTIIEILMTSFDTMKETFSLLSLVFFLSLLQLILIFYGIFLKCYRVKNQVSLRVLVAYFLLFVALYL